MNSLARSEPNIFEKGHVTSNWGTLTSRLVVLKNCWLHYFYFQFFPITQKSSTCCSVFIIFHMSVHQLTFELSPNKLADIIIFWLHLRFSLNEKMHFLEKCHSAVWPYWATREKVSTLHYKTCTDTLQQCHVPSDSENVGTILLSDFMKTEWKNYFLKLIFLYKSTKKKVTLENDLL